MPCRGTRKPLRGDPFDDALGLRSPRKQRGNVVKKRTSKEPAKAQAKSISPATRQRRPSHISGAQPQVRSATDDARFAEVVALIEAAQARAFQAVNSELVSLYWQLGEYIGRKIASAEWGDGIVDELAATLARRYPAVRGFTRRNLFRMRQFHEAYKDNKKVSALLTQLPWTHHLIILSQAKPTEAREFYILAAIKQRWSKRQLEREIASGGVLRGALASKKVSPVVTQIHPTAIDEFKNAYNFEFLSLPDVHSEADLHGALVRNLGRA
jgi:predicted nuclease of restriction endonuclease-like (RecB) superfamily